MVDINTKLNDLAAYMTEFRDMEIEHEAYLTKFREVTKLQGAELKVVKQKTYILSQLHADISRYNVGNLSDDERQKFSEANHDILRCQVRLNEISSELPVRDNKFYLSLILGSNLNLSLLNQDDRYQYKKEYEKFKVSVNYVMLFTLTVAFFFDCRFIDSVCSFLLVWYYCTLTIREAILSINGSRIKGWWKLHHYVSCILCAFFLTWKEGACYSSYRRTFLFSNIYMSVVQLLQCRYQTGCLRRLHALGQRYSMDITVEGFSGWMFKGLSFLIPFLVIVYIFQFYNAYTFYRIYTTMDCPGQWQIPALGIGFFFIACCNSFTLAAVIINKWKQRWTNQVLLNHLTQTSSVEKTQ